MTDRELLEEAAKAAGYELDYTIRPDGKAFYHSDRNAMALADGGWFAPLTDDGDALRLAVKLQFHIQVDAKDLGEVFVFCGIPGPFSEDATSDPCAALRRAIVRAAAAIGSAMDGSNKMEVVR